MYTCHLILSREWLQQKRGSHSFLKKPLCSFFWQLHISHEMRNLIFKDKEKVFLRLSFQKSRHVTFLCSKQNIATIV